MLLEIFSFNPLSHKTARAWTQKITISYGETATFTVPLSYPTMFLEIFSFNLLHIAHSVQGAKYSLLRDAAEYEVCDHSSLKYIPVNHYSLGGE